jgi:hypothetical protein
LEVVSKDRVIILSAKRLEEKRKAVNGRMFSNHTEVKPTPKTSALCEAELRTNVNLFLPLNLWSILLKLGLEDYKCINSRSNSFVGPRRSSDHHVGRG